MASVHHGVVYTKKWVVNLILDVAGYVPGTGISDKVIVEPSCGCGAFLTVIAAGDAPMFPDDVKERFARTDFILDMYESGVYNREEAGEKLFDHLFGKGRAVIDSEG